jgi:hypothetical protein
MCRFMLNVFLAFTIIMVVTRLVKGKILTSNMVQNVVPCNVWYEVSGEQSRSVSRELLPEQEGLSSLLEMMQIEVIAEIKDGRQIHIGHEVCDIPHGILCSVSCLW